MDQKHDALKSSKECRHSILDYFSLLLNDLNEKMESLFESGVDEENFVLLEGTNIEWQSNCYTVLSKEFVDILLFILKEDDGKQIAKELKDLFSTYSEDYSKLLTSYFDLIINLKEVLNQILES